MIIVENTLLEAVRAAIVEAEIVKDYECEIELDDQAPAIVGDRYIAISADGLNVVKSSPEVMEAEFGVRIAVYQRVSSIPRDRRRNIYRNLLLNINSRLDSIANLFHFSTQLTCSANDTLEDEGIQGKFTTPLKIVRVDQKPRTVSFAEFAARNENKGDQQFALIRGINFGQAKYIGYRT